MTHLTPDELIDAMEELLSGDRRRHLESCPECQRQLEDLAGVLNEAKQTSVPEPPPFSLEQLSAQLNAEIDKQLGDAWPRWMRWQTLLPVGAVAMIILALMASVPKRDRNETSGIEAIIAPEPQAEPDQWVALADLVGDFDIDAAAETGVIEPGLAEQAVLELTAEEQAELTRLLQAELRAKS